MLSDSQITKFQNLYQQKFGLQISKEEALEKGLKLVRLFELIYKPMAVDDCKKVLERQRQLQN